MSQQNISSDLIWEVVRNQNAFLVKRKTAGGVQFSRDPFNLVNKHSRTQAGFVNEKAVSVQPSGENAVSVKTKKTKGANKPATAYNSHTYGAAVSNRNIYKNIADQVGKRSYRGDLTSSAVARASAIRDSQRVKKDRPASKLRGSAARKATAA